jgi:hypothetical protein
MISVFKDNYLYNYAEFTSKISQANIGFFCRISHRGIDKGSIDLFCGDPQRFKRTIGR